MEETDSHDLEAVTRGGRVNQELATLIKWDFRIPDPPVTLVQMAIGCRCIRCHA